MERIIKIGAVFFAFFLILFFCAGCGYTGAFPYSESKNQISKIEIVQAVNSRQFNVILEIPEEERGSFLDDLEGIVFHKAMFGDPLDVGGVAIRIVYYDDSYDILNDVWSDYCFYNNDNELIAEFTKMCCNREEYDRFMEKWDQMSNKE